MAYPMVGRQGRWLLDHPDGIRPEAGPWPQIAYEIYLDVKWPPGNQSVFRSVRGPGGFEVRLTNTSFAYNLNILRLARKKTPAPVC